MTMSVTMTMKMTMILLQANKLFDTYDNMNDQLGRVLQQGSFVHRDGVDHPMSPHAEDPHNQFNLRVQVAWRDQVPGWNRVR